MNEYKTCKRGHVRSPENVTVDGSCRVCKNFLKQEKRKANRVEKPKATHCKYGHPRTPDNVYKGNGGCKECIKIKSRQSKIDHPERYAEYYKNYAKRNKDKVRQSSVKWHSNDENKRKKKKWQKEYYQNFPERRKETLSNYYAKNKDKIARYRKQWEKENPEKCRSLLRKRQAAKLQRTPPWLTKQQIKDIEVFYLLAVIMTKETGIKHHVDHIVPLRGKVVSGLHVPWNLQVITAVENSVKCNSFTHVAV